MPRRFLEGEISQQKLARRCSAPDQLYLLRGAQCGNRFPSSVLSTEGFVGVGDENWAGGTGRFGSWGWFGN